MDTGRGGGRAVLSKLRTAWGRLMSPLADALLKMGVTPDMVTIGGTVVSVVLALWLLPTGHLFLGAKAPPRSEAMRANSRAMS